MTREALDFIQRNDLHEVVVNRTGDGQPWLTERQLECLRSQLLRQPNRTLPEANEAAQYGIAVNGLRRSSCCLTSSRNPACASP